MIYSVVIVTAMMEAILSKLKQELLMQNYVFSLLSIQEEYAPLMKTEFRGQNKIMPYDLS